MLGEALPATCNPSALSVVALAVALFLGKSNTSVRPIMAVGAKRDKVFVSDIMLVGRITWLPICPGDADVMDA
jgi:hypothetical protein